VGEVGDGVGTVAGVSEGLGRWGELEFLELG